MSIYTKIGEYVVQITNGAPELSEEFHRLSEPLFHQEVEPDMMITIIGPYGQPFTSFDVAIKQNKDSITFSRADYLIESNLDYSEAIVSVHDELSLKHALMALYSAFIVQRGWGLLMHSSCVIDNGVAHIFSGQSGAGKSTAAKLSYPRTLLSDEASIVKIGSEGVWVYNSPFRSELEPTEFSGPKPLASIQLLNQSLHNQRVELAKPQAFIQLIDKVFYWKKEAGDTKQIMALLHRLVEQVPVYNLFFQKNNTFWELIS